MINGETIMTRIEKKSSNSNADLFNQSKRDDDAFHKQIRARFFLQSAQYLGADLNDTMVRSLCFRD